MFKNKIFFPLLLVALPVCFAHAGRCILTTSEITTLYFGVEIDLPYPEHPLTIPTAHTDIEIPIRFGIGWDIHIKTDLPAANTRVETEDGLFFLGTEHYYSGSVPAAFEFIGADSGEGFWYYNQSAPPAAGFDSQDIMSTEAGELCSWDPNDPGHNATGSGKWLQVNLVEVRGPEGGHVSMWHESGTTPVVFFSTYEGGITEDDVYYIHAGAHSHNSWGFTKSGLYEVDIRASTYHLCDESLIADINEDCKVDIKDFALMAGQWLLCGSSFGAGCL